MSSATRVGLLGGTFDPPHLAHLVIAAAARRALQLDHVIFVPAGEPWRKAERSITDARTRLEMVEAAVQSALPWAEVSAVEVEREGPSYTVDTLERLGEHAPGAEWWFLLGRDALTDLPNWHEPARLVELARLGLVQRPSDDRADGGPVPRVALDALPDIAERIDPVPMPQLEVSATDLRRRVREGQPTAPLLPAAVRRMVDELGLYRGSD